MKSQLNGIIMGVIEAE